MQLGVARLCLDCHEVHAAARCPVCTSEAFAFITRWIQVDNASARADVASNEDGVAAAKIETYRQILHPSPKGSRAGRWLRNGGLLLAAGYLARWGWQIASRQTDGSDGHTKGSAQPLGD